MSEEKRFVCMDIGYGDDWYITDNGERLSEIEIVDLLNEQNQLIKNLEEENEELKEIHQKGSKSCEKWKQHKEAQIQQLEKENKELEKVNEDLREVNKENQLLHEENVKQCERWKNLYELKDAEVTARVDALNRVCNYYLTEVQFIADVDPNEAVKEVINEILNAPIYEE